MFKSEVLKLFRTIFGQWLTAAPPRPKPRPRIKLMLEELEKRWCPASPGTDTLIWDPQQGINSNPANAQNWYDATTGKTATQGPTATNPIQLSGSQSAYNQPITLTQQLSVASLTVTNQYNSNLIIANGGSLNTSANDEVQLGSTLNLTSGSTKGIVLTNGANFTVQLGGTLNLQDATPAVTGETFITATGDKPGEILSNGGTVTWTGTAVPTGNPAIFDVIAAPVLNSGTFNVNGGTGNKPNLARGGLTILGADPLTNNVSFYQTMMGAFNFSNMAYVTATQGYYQGGGSLTSDATPTGGSPCTLQAGDDNNGDININNGKVTVGDVANNIGTLQFAAKTVEIDGTINVSGEMTGGGSTACDVLDCGSAAVSVGADSALVVGTTGTGALGLNNDWVVMKYGSITGSWGAQNKPIGMTIDNAPTKVELTGPT